MDVGRPDAALEDAGPGTVGDCLAWTRVDAKGLGTGQGLVSAQGTVAGK